MRKFFPLLFLLTLAVLPIRGQVTFESIEVLQNLPSNLSCTNNSPLIKVASGSKAGFYQCLNGTLTAIGVTNGGSLAVSGTVTAPASLTSNAMPSGLIAWYPLTEATGITPKDISGNGNNATLPGGSNNPTGSQYGYQFPSDLAMGDGHYFILPTAVSSAGLTYAAYLCPPVFNQAPFNGVVSNQYYDNFILGASDNASGGLVLGLQGGTTDAWMMMPSLAISGTDGSPRTKTLDVDTGCHVFIWEVGVSPTVDRLFVDGVEVNYSSQGSSGAALGVGNLRIGYGTGGGMTYHGGFLGTMRDVWVWNRDLTTAEVQAFAATATQIARQQGVQTYAPKNGTTSTVECNGDSITQAQGLTSFCSSSLLVPSESIAVNNLGIYNYFMGALLGEGVPQSLTLFNANAPHNTVILFACSNDLTSTNNVTASSCYSITAATAKRFSNAGFKVILMPMLSRVNGGTNMDSLKDSLDALYTANWQTFANYYISPTDANLWADGASANTTYFNSDKTHPTQTGQNLLGTYATNAYNKLYGSTSTSWNTTAASTYTIAAADSYLAVTANSTLTLPDCKGYSGSWSIKVNPGLTVSLKTATAAETLDGVDRSVTGLSLTAGSVTGVVVVPSAPATATCTWRQVQ